MADILQSILGSKTISFHAIFAKALGSVPAAVMLSQAFFWQEKANHPSEGVDIGGVRFFKKTGKQWYEETGLSKEQQQTARNTLGKCGVLLSVKKGLPAVMHYRVDVETLVAVISAYLETEKPVTSDNRSNKRDITRTSSGKFRQLNTVKNGNNYKESIGEPLESGRELLPANAGSDLSVTLIEGKAEVIVIEEKPQGEENLPPAAQKPVPVVHRLLEAFETEHKKHFSPDGAWIGFNWKKGGKHFEGLKELAEKLTDSFTLKAPDKRKPTDDELVASFTLFMQKGVDADKFIRDNWFTPCDLNSQYQKIIQKIYAAKNGTGKQGANATGGNPVAGTTNSPFGRGFKRQNP